MNIITTRRITQVFFFLLFLWFCVVTSLGDRGWQLRGWPVNWLLELDPLVALGTLLTTKTIYAGLIWALVTVALTILVGRFFCGWVCPFGALHQFIGWLGRRRKKHAERVALNQYRRGQVIKYYILIGLLTAAACGLIGELIRLPRQRPMFIVLAIVGGLLVVVWLSLKRAVVNFRKGLVWIISLVFAWTALSWLVRPDALAAASLQTGLLDPIPLFHRSVNLALLPAIEKLSTNQRFYTSAWLIGAVFFTAVLLNLAVPRFYCRFICPLGALFGVFTRWTPWRIGKREGKCNECELCENNCEGACEPFEKIRLRECLLCMNCLDACRQVQMTYGPNRSAAGENETSGVTRRGFFIASLTGLAAEPVARLSGVLGANWRPRLVRPPGALTEELFLERCVKCGQCMRVCPTNVIQPATFDAGLEGLWTPVLNFRAGTSGCQLNCVACGNMCPTAAIRPLTLDEKLGRAGFETAGPVRMGLAFVDRSRCLPCTMDKPCIVCQENCPVSPKAIFLREEFSVIRDGVFAVKSASPTSVTVEGAAWRAGRFATGDYYARPADGAEQERRPITDTTADMVMIASTKPWITPPAAGGKIVIEVRLQKPFVDPELCIGCGICEHECPVNGLRAIRVTAENETRNRKHSLTGRA